MAKFRKRPVVIEAVQLDWTTWGEMCEFIGVGRLVDGKAEGCWLDADGNPVPDGSPIPDNDAMGLLIPTLEGVMVGRRGDWIIRGVKSEFYPCKPDVFDATYGRVDE